MIIEIRKEGGNFSAWTNGELISKCVRLETVAHGHEQFAMLIARTDVIEVAVKPMFVHEAISPLPEKESPAWDERDYSELGLSVRAMNVLDRGGLYSKQAIIECGLAELLLIENCGIGTVVEIIEAIPALRDQVPASGPVRKRLEDKELRAKLARYEEREALEDRYQQ